MFQTRYHVSDAIDRMRKRRRTNHYRVTTGQLQADDTPRLGPLLFTHHHVTHLALSLLSLYFILSSVFLLSVSKLVVVSVSSPLSIFDMLLLNILRAPIVAFKFVRRFFVSQRCFVLEL